MIPHPHLLDRHHHPNPNPSPNLHHPSTIPNSNPNSTPQVSPPLQPWPARAGPADSGLCGIRGPLDSAGAPAGQVHLAVRAAPAAAALSCQSARRLHRLQLPDEYGAAATSAARAAAGGGGESRPAEHPRTHEAPGGGRALRGPPPRAVWPAGCQLPRLDLWGWRRGDGGSSAGRHNRGGAAPRHAVELGSLWSRGGGGGGGGRRWCGIYAGALHRMHRH